MSDNYTEETRPLFKLLRNPAFRLIIVRFNHYGLVQRLVRDLQTTFPDRPFVRIDTASATYQSITEAFFGVEGGLILLDHFEDALKEAGDSLGKETAGMQADNERRRGITAGLNLRRDKLARVSNALLLLIPASGTVLYAKAIMEKMPDLWSFRSLMLDLAQDMETAPARLPDAKWRPEVPVLGTAEVEAREAELSRLLNLVKQTSPAETQYLATLWPQIAEIQQELGAYEKALDSLRAWEQVAGELEQGEVLARQGNIQIWLGRLAESDVLFQRANALFEAQGDRLSLVKSFFVLADIHQDLGNQEQAQHWIMQGIKRAEEALADAPKADEFRFQLGRGYDKIGEMYRSLGALTQALHFFELHHQLMKDLYYAYPHLAKYKNGLAIAYERFGTAYSSLQNFEKALTYFEKKLALAQELHEAYPEDVEFKNELAVSYHHLGHTHNALGNLEKALTCFEKELALTQELHEALPQHVYYKNGLAISNYQTAQTYQQLSLPEKAKSCLIQAEKILVELVNTDPDNEYVQKLLKNTRIELSRLQPKHLPMENPIDQVKRLLLEDNIEQALRMLFAMIAKIAEQKRSASHIDDLFNPAGGDAEEAEKPLILLAARVNRANKALHAGTIDFEVNSQERNRVIYGILDNLHYFTKQRGDNQEPQEDLVQVIDLGKLLEQFEELERTF